jgi:Na+-driven multidrug efflux pump
MSSVAAAESKRAAIALAVGGAVTSLLRLLTNVADHSLPAYLLIIPASFLAALLGGRGPHSGWLATIINMIIYSGGTYLVLWSRQKRQRRPRTQKRVGVIDEILSQERTPIFTGASLVASLLIFGLMLVTFARWHENLGFGGLAVFPFYATGAFIGVATNVVFGCIAIARDESYAGRVAVVSALICVLAAFALALLTH